MDKLLERKRVVPESRIEICENIGCRIWPAVLKEILYHTRKSRLTAVVVNFIDMLAHGRSDSPPPSKKLPRTKQHTVH